VSKRVPLMRALAESKHDGKAHGKVALTQFHRHIGILQTSGPLERSFVQHRVARAIADDDVLDIPTAREPHLDLARALPGLFFRFRRVLRGPQDA